MCYLTFIFLLILFFFKLNFFTIKIIKEFFIIIFSFNLNIFLLIFYNLIFSISLFNHLIYDF